MERERLHAIEEEQQRKKQQELMAREKRQKQLVENIEQQMDGWFQAQRLRNMLMKLKDTQSQRRTRRQRNLWRDM